jgi:hypothetical protein
MAYQPCRFSVTLLCYVCISVFCTPLALSVPLPFIISAPYPFNETFLYCAFLLLRSASLLTLESFPRQQPNLFFVPPSYSPCAPCACNISMPLHAHIPQICSTSRVLSLIMIVTLHLLWRFSPRVQHHWVFCLDFSASLEV